MAEQPKRRAWFQLHLSTCVVLMCVAGFGMYLNLVPSNYFTYLSSFTVSGTAHVYGFGWSNLAYWFHEDEDSHKVLWNAWSLRGVCLNIAVVVAALILISLAFELIVRSFARTHEWLGLHPYT